MDLISRQTALDAFGLSEKTRKYGGDHSGYDTMMLYEIQDILEGLPSAEPEIIYCKNCKYYTKIFGWNGEEYTVCSEEGHHRSLVSADDFCSCAERRTDEHEK